MSKQRNQINKKDKVPLNLTLIFIALSIGIILLGIYFYNSQKEDLITQQENELTTISDYKAKQIETWLDERINHANSVLLNQYRIEQIRLFLNNPEARDQKENISEWFQHLCGLYNYYDATLYDNNYNPLISVPLNEYGYNNQEIEIIRKNEPINEVKISDFQQYDSASPIHINIFIPIKYISNENNELTAILVFNADVQSSIFATLLEIPTRYNTMESLIAQKKDDYVLFLNELKFKQQTALKFKIPLTEKDVLSVQAVEGKEGIIYGKDYRKKEVLGCIKFINGTSWFLITKIDMDEINSPILRRTSILFLNVLFGIILAGIILGLIWRHQRAKHYRLLYQKEFESSAMAEHYAYLSKYANDMILLLDENLNIIDANDRATERLGYTKEEMLKLNVKDIRKPGEIKNISSNKKLLDLKGGIVFETENVKKDGGTIPVEISTRLINIEGKIFYQSIIRDISERKKNEEIIRKNENLTNAVIHNSPVGITIRSVSGELLEYNKAWMDIWGLDDEKIKELEKENKNLSYNERYFYFGKNVKNIKDVFEKGEYQFIPEIKINNPYSGKEIWLSIYLYALKSNNKTERIVTLTRNITEQKKAEEKLKESEEKHRSIIEHSTILFYSHSPDHVITYISPQSKQFFDCKPDEALVNWTSFATDNPVNDLGIYLTKKALETGKAQPPYELELKGKKDRIIWVEVNESPVVVNGKTVLMVGSLTDITERKKNEEKIYKLNRIYRVISEINLAIVRINNKDELFSRICKILIVYGKLKMAWIAEIDLAAKVMKPLAVWGDDGNYLKVLLSNTAEILKEKALLPKLLDGYRVKAYNDSSVENNLFSSWRHEFIKQDFGSYCFVPLKRNSEKYLVLNIYSSDSNFFDDNEIKLLSELGADISYALDKFETENLRKRAEDALNKTTSRLKLLFDSSSRLNKSLDTNVIYSEIYDFISKTMECDSFFVSNYDNEKQLISCSAAWLEGKRVDTNSFPPIPLEAEGKGTQSKVIRSGESMIINDYPGASRNNKTFFYIDTKGRTHTQIPDNAVRTQSALMVPLKIEDKVIGVVQVLSYKENAYSEDDLNILESLVLHISSAINNAILYRLAQNEIQERKRTLEELKIAENALKNSKEQLLLLYETSENLNRSLNLEDTYEVIINFVSKFMDCEGLIVSEYNGKEQKIYYKAAWIQGVWSDTANIPPIDLAPEGRGILSRVINSGSSLIIDDYITELEKSKTKFRVDEEGKTYAIDSESKDNTRSALMVPLKLEGNVIGVLHVISFRKNAYTEEHKKLLESISVHISFAINNATLYRLAREEINERRRTEEELRRSEERFFNIFDLNPVATLLTRAADGKIIDANEQCLSLLEYKHEELINKAIVDLNVWADYPEREKILSELEMKMYLKDREIKLRQKNGKFIDTLISFQILTISGEKCILSIITDITQKKKSEEQLRKLSRAVNQSPASIVITDTNGNIEYVNSKFSEVTGFTFKEVIDQKPSILKSGETPVEVYKELWEMISSGSEWHGELHNKKKNGELYWEWASISPIIDTEGRITNYLAVKEDITASKIIQEQIQLQAILMENISDAVIYSDNNLKIKSWNKAAEEVYGWKAEEVINKVGPEILNSKFVNTTFEEVNLNIKENGKWTGEIIHTKKDGRKINILASSSFVKDDKGNKIGYLSVNRDITILKNAEEKIKNSLKEKEILLKEIHHRVKNNLQVISSLLKMQASYIKDPVALEYFKISSQRVKSMALIHEQLYRSSDLSRIDFYNYVKRLTTHLYQTYGVSFNTVKLNLKIQNIKLSIDTAIPCGLLINELISNSLKHGFPEGQKGKIVVEIAKDKNQFVLIVGDNGKGFPDNIDFRDTKTLGMQLINTLTEQLDGKINLNKENGTEFIITFKADEYSERI